MKLKTGQTVWAVLAYSVFLELCLHLITYGMTLLYDNWVYEAVNHLANLLPIFLTTLVCVAVVFRVTDRGRLAGRFVLKLAVDLLLTAGLTVGIYVLLLGGYNLFVARVDVEYGSVLAVFLITMLMVELFYYMQYSRLAAEKAEQSRREAMQYQYEAFRAQFNPHFLFNSLSLLMEMIETDRERAVSYTGALSDIYRYVLQMHRKPRVTMSEELAFLRSYVQILELKYNHFLQVDVLRTGDTERDQQRYVVPFSLQILVENVTKHNVISDRYPMRVEVRVDDRSVTVSNPVRRKRAAAGSGTGLGLKYLQVQYAASGQAVEIRDRTDSFEVKIPYIR